MENDKAAMETVNMRMPSKMKAELVRTAKLRKLSGYQALIREYCADGLRRDAERFEWSAVIMVVEALKERGVSEQVIDEALQAAVVKMPQMGN